MPTQPSTNAREPQSVRGTDGDWNERPMTDLVRHILDRHHTFTRRELDRLCLLADEVASAHGDRHPELLKVRALFRELDDELRPHLMKEEAILFPHIASLDMAARAHRTPPSAPFGTIENPVRMMTVEHERAQELLDAIRAATNDYGPPADACESHVELYVGLAGFELDLREHIRLESDLLFPRAIEIEDA